MMRVNFMRPGERYTLDGHDPETNGPVTTTFTLLCVDWFQSPYVPAAFFHGAIGVTKDGRGWLLDPITLEFCQPLLCLPAPKAN